MSEGSEKLARSRQAIIEHLARKQRKHDPRETLEGQDFEQGWGDDDEEARPGGGGWWGRMAHALKVWWRYHPASVAVELTTPLVRGYARRKPVQLLAEDRYARAWPGGTGEYKLGANYAPTILPQVEAAKRGYSQVLWLVGAEHELSEVGTMNLFVFWINEKGERELRTAPLDGTILPGVTRDSVLALTRTWGEFKVVEGSMNMRQLIKALEENRVLEIFGAGTAAVVSAVDKIAYKKVEYKVPLDKSDPKAAAGPLAVRLFNEITKIQYGEKQFRDWSKVLD